MGWKGDEVAITMSDPGAAKAVIQTLPDRIRASGQFPEPVQPNDDDPVCAAAGGGRGTDRV